MKISRSSKRVNYRYVFPGLRIWLKEFRKLAGVKVRADLFKQTSYSRAASRITITNRMPTGLRIRVNLNCGYQVFNVFFVASQRGAVESFLQKPVN